MDPFAPFIPRLLAKKSCGMPTSSFSKKLALVSRPCVKAAVPRFTGVLSSEVDEDVYEVRDPDVQAGYKASGPVAVEEEPVPVAGKIGTEFSGSRVDDWTDVDWSARRSTLVVRLRYVDVVAASWPVRLEAK